MNMATITLEKSLLNEMGHIMGNEDLMTQTIKFVRSIRRKAKALKNVRVAKNSKHLTWLILKPTSKVSDPDAEY